MFLDLPLTSLRPRKPFEEAGNPQFAQLCISISQLGMMNPLTVTQDNVILDGYWRYQAARELGIKEVPCHVVQVTLENIDEYDRIRSYRWGSQTEQEPNPLTYEG